MTDAFTLREWKSPDGLTLRFRDYPGREDRPPILCLHGLTRNARDFAGLAEWLAGNWRVIVPEMRGRGGSDYSSDPASYSIATYIGDIDALRAQEDIHRFVAIGTSMGGLMTMVQAARDASPIAGVLLNDIGPMVEAGGLEKIRTYVGQMRSFPTWMHAARALSETHGAAHPGFALDDWIAMAKRTMVLCANGRISFDYDARLAEPILAGDAGAVPADLWAGFEPLADKPLLLVRGERSDLLSETTFREMQRRAPGARAVSVRDTGHAPTLDEPEVRAAIEDWLGEIAAS
jgi:pimeloyl-ACP methyl ester carboxylesterase